MIGNKCIRGIGTDDRCKAKRRKGLVCNGHHARLRAIAREAGMNQQPPTSYMLSTGVRMWVTPDVDLDWAIKFLGEEA